MMNDLEVARKMVRVAAAARDREKDFNLSFLSFKNMMKAKKCKLSGLPLNKDSFTVDRINNQLGYIKGNVCACHKMVNRAKNNIESLNLDPEVLKRILKNWSSHL